MKYKEKGLTIVELLITISILVTTVTIVLALGNRAVSNASLFSAYSQANFLAKEGMEILEDETIRANIWAKEGSNYWNVDYEGNIDEKNDVGECHNKLRINNEGFYAIGSDPLGETSFSRCVKSIKFEDELNIEVEVKFNYLNRDYSVNVYRIFYD
jgi:hypothetical protein